MPTCHRTPRPSMRYAKNFARTIMFMSLGMVLFNAGTARSADLDQQSFATSEQAADALAAAWTDGSRAAMLKIFGPAGIKLVVSGDKVAEAQARAKLAAEYTAQHKLEKVNTNKVVLVLGESEYPYPIPIVKQGDSWRFDTKAGAEEIINRRIGRNELNAISVCRTYVEAQREYAQMDSAGTGLHEYALHGVSSNGKHDGLYWPAAADKQESPFGPLFADAVAEGYSPNALAAKRPYHGYHYKVLTRQGASAQGGALDYSVDGHMTRGFALLAFPARYGNSGVMSFIVNQHGIVFEKNLGPQTTRLAHDMSEYNPDASWKPVAN